MTARPDTSDSAGPLAGVTVVVTRARSQAGSLARLLEQRGARVLAFPTIQIVDPDDWGPADAAIRDLDGYDWLVLTSANTVERFFARVADAGADVAAHATLRVAAVGPATAAACEARGVTPDFVPAEHVGEGVLEGLLERGAGPGVRVLLPRATDAREVLPEELRAHGSVVDVVPVYKTVPAAPDPEVLQRFRNGAVDVVTFTSSSTVRNFAAMLAGVDTSSVTFACIGPVTSRTAAELGMKVAVEPVEYTVPALVDAIVEHYATA